MNARLAGLGLCLVGVWLLWPADGPARVGAASTAPAPEVQAQPFIPARSEAGRPAGAAPVPAIDPAASALTPASLPALSAEQEERLAEEAQSSDTPLADKMATLSALLGGEPSALLVQGRYALELDALAEATQGLPLAERLTALSELQDRWVQDEPALGADLFNPAARLLQARQLWPDDPVAPMARHFLPKEQAEATLAFEATQQAQRTERQHYQEALAELEASLALRRDAMDEASWQAEREEAIGRFRRDFFTPRPPAQP